MAHLLPSQLSRLLAQAAAQVQVGAVYEHYKGQLYRVTGLAILEASDEVGVIYQAQYGTHTTFVRPLADWLAIVELNGQTAPRFKLVTSNI